MNRKVTITGNYEAKTPMEMAEELADGDFIDYGAVILEAHIECGTDLEVTFRDIDGAIVGDSIPISDISDLRDWYYCVGAVDEHGNELILCFG